MYLNFTLLPPNGCQKVSTEPETINCHPKTNKYRNTSEEKESRGVDMPILLADKKAS